MPYTPPWQGDPCSRQDSSGTIDRNGTGRPANTATVTDNRQGFTCISGLGFLPSRGRAGWDLRRISLPDGIAFTGEGKLVRKVTGYERNRRPTSRRGFAGYASRASRRHSTGSVTHRFLCRGVFLGCNNCLDFGAAGLNMSRFISAEPQWFLCNAGGSATGIWAISSSD
jgi:hypothetical protein